MAHEQKGRASFFQKVQIGERTGAIKPPATGAAAAGTAGMDSFVGELYPPRMAVSHDLDSRLRANNNLRRFSSLGLFLRRAKERSAGRTQREECAGNPGAVVRSVVKTGGNAVILNRR